MKLRAAVTAFALIILATAVFGVLWLNAGRGAELSLPPETRPSDVSVTAAPNAGSYPRVEVTRENVKTLIATLTRPAAYRMRTSVELFAGDDAFVSEFMIYKRGNVTRADDLTAGKVSITTEDYYYERRAEDADYTALPRGSFTPDQGASVPSYEDVSDFPDEDVKNAGYRAVGGIPVVEVNAEVDGFAYEYAIDLEYGLLLSASASKDGRVLWKFTRTELEVGEQSEELFAGTEYVTALH